MDLWAAGSRLSDSRADHDSFDGLLIAYTKRNGGGGMDIFNYEMPIDLQLDAVQAICQRYGVAHLALFGSVLRDDFTDQSDIDVLCRLRPDSPARGLQWVALDLALAEIWNRQVDLIKPHLLDARIRD